MGANDFLSKVNNINIVNRTFTNKLAFVTNKLKDVTELISEVFRSLGELETLITQIGEIIYSELGKIELSVKEVLLEGLNSLVSCSINPLIPDELITEGVDIEIKNLDYLKIFKNKPTSEIGKVTYYDVANGLNSNDLNVFLWNVIDKANISQGWRQLINVTFTPINTTTNKTNIFNICINSRYRGKHFKEFNADFVKELDIYNEKTLVSSILDMSFGLITLGNKTSSEIAIQNEINSMVETIMNSDDDFEQNDSALYGFSTDEYNKRIKETIRQKFNLVSTNGGKVQTNVTFDDTKSFLLSVDSTTTVNEKIGLFNNFVKSIAIGDTTNKKPKVDTNVLRLILKNLLTAVASSILSPKILTIFYVNLYGIYGKDVFEKGVDIKMLISLLKNIIYSLIKKVSKMLIDYFTKKLQELIMNKIVLPTLERKIGEKVEMRLKQIQTLVTGKLDKIINSITK